MPGACSQVLEAGNSLLTAAQQLRVDPHNRSVRLILVESAKKVLEYTVNVSEIFSEQKFSTLRCKLKHDFKMVQEQLSS